MAIKVGDGGANKPCKVCRLRHCICKLEDKEWNEREEEREKCSTCGLVYCICSEAQDDDSEDDSRLSQ